MESRRRLSILCSHLLPVSPSPASPLSSSITASASENHAASDTRNRQRDCVFCRIIRGESPAFKLYEDDTCLCILDTSPVVAAMCSKVPIIGNAIMKATGSDSFNLLVNNGAAAGQVIFHTHIHIIPRKACDCLWTTESLRRHPLNFDHEASQLVNCVREQLSNISEGGKGQESSLS